VVEKEIVGHSAKITGSIVQVNMRRKTNEVVEKVTAGVTRKWAGVDAAWSRKNLKPEKCL
jgi:hypothetical protein